MSALPLKADIHRRALKQRQDHGTVDNNQRKAFSEATVFRKAADVRSTQQRHHRAPNDGPQFSIFQNTGLIDLGKIEGKR